MKVRLFQQIGFSYSLINASLLPVQKNLQFIQLLRGIACLLVLLLHITMTFSETYHTYFLWNFFKFGGCGVDIFFVLSGFIITYSNRQHIGEVASIPKFIKKRAIRIFPIYWIIISFFLFLQVLLPAFYRTHFNLSPGNLLTTFFLFPNHNMVNGVSWSLTNELFFYLLFTLALIIPDKKYSLLLLLLYFVILTVLPAFTTSTDNSAGFMQLLLFPMNIEFLLGIAAVFFLEKFSVKWCLPILLTGIAYFILSAFFYTAISQLFTNAYGRVIMFGLPSFLIIVSLVKYELTTPVKVNNIFLQLGNASYSIYLFHLPIVAAFFKIMVKLPVTNHLLLVLLSCGLLVSVCVAGIVIYKKIESPLINFLNKKLA